MHLYLQAAEELSSRLLSSTTPRDLPPCVVPPAACLLARVRCALGGVLLAAAQERERLAEEDKRKARPKFPQVSGGPPSQ